jgi:hypothetical protein
MVTANTQSLCYSSNSQFETIAATSHRLKSAATTKKPVQTG